MSARQRHFGTRIRAACVQPSRRFCRQRDNSCPPIYISPVFGDRRRRLNRGRRSPGSLPRFRFKNESCPRGVRAPSDHPSPPPPPPPPPPHTIGIQLFSRYSTRQQRVGRTDVRPAEFSSGLLYTRV